MRPITETDSMDRLYEILMYEIETFGHEANPRGLACKELRPHHFTLFQPQQGLYRGITRRLNYRFFAVETLQYIAGWGDKPEHAELLIAANGNVLKFLNMDSGMFDGAYGPRLKEGLQYCYDKLKADPDSRQAVACIWKPGVVADSKDIPCTVALQFYQDLGFKSGSIPRLGMMATMRSNDINWGTPYDVAAFTAIQCAMAGSLGWHLGDYHHSIGSLHAYEEKLPSIKPYSEETRANVRLPCLSSHLREFSCEWRIIQSMADSFLSQLYSHRCEDDEPWHTFNPIIREYAGYGDDVFWTRWHAYWKDWADLVRWRWCDNVKA